MPIWQQLHGTRFLFDGRRRTTTSEVKGLTLAWSLFNQSAEATDIGGLCFGDSGSPQFVPGTNMIVSTTTGGDPNCRANNYNYRLDTVGRAAISRPVPDFAVNDVESAARSAIHRLTWIGRRRLLRRRLWFFETQVRQETPACRPRATSQWSACRSRKGAPGRRPLGLVRVRRPSWQWASFGMSAISFNRPWGSRRRHDANARCRTDRRARTGTHRRCVSRVARVRGGAIERRFASRPQHRGGVRERAREPHPPGDLDGRGKLAHEGRRRPA